MQSPASRMRTVDHAGFRYWPSLSILLLQIALSIASAQSSLLLQPRHLVFSTVAGEAPTGPQQVRVLNDGGGAVGWSVSQRTSWLNIDSSGGTTPAAPNVSAI